jgi:hypothetical protein
LQATITVTAAVILLIQRSLIRSEKAHGAPRTPVRSPINLHIDGPFYVGIGFCSHLPDKSDTAVLSDVVLENSAGKVP